MGFKPNFTSAKIIGDEVRIGGVSDEEDTDDIVGIHVTLVQGDRVASGPLLRLATVDKLTSVWNVTVPVEDPDDDAGDLRPGPVAAFGIEWRKTNAATSTWSQTLTITD